MMIENIMILAQNNPGTMTFAFELNAKSPNIIDKLIKLNIVGTDAYVLWSDICGKDLTLLDVVINNCADNVLIDASSRQDYSGRNIPEIKHIVDAYNVFKDAIKST